ncbi:hypothetical protein UT5_21120 [Ferrigenium sp. UT5]
MLGLHSDPARPQMSFDGVWYNLAHGQQIHLMQLPDPGAGLTRPAHGGRDRHVAFVVSNLADLKHALEAAAITCRMSQSGRRALFCHDPDQNALEFIEAMA